MPYNAIFEIDDDINEYSYNKAYDVLEQAIELAPERVLSAIAAYLSHDQLIQFVGDELVDDWDDLRPDGWDDEEEDDEDIEDDDSGEDE